MKVFARLLPFIFFVLLILLIATIISGFWIRNQKISAIPQKIIETAINILSPVEETQNVTPDSGLTTSADSIEVTVSNLTTGIGLISSPSKSPQPVAISADGTAKTSLKLEPGVNIFKLVVLDQNDFRTLQDINFVYFRSEDIIPADSTAIYGEVISTLGNNIELKSLISQKSYTLSTTSSTSFIFVNPREKNDGILDQGLKDIERLEVGDIIVGVGPIQNEVQNTLHLVSYANKAPVIAATDGLKSGQVASVDSRRESITLSGDKTRYYWDDNTQILNSPSFTPPAKDQQILFFATTNSYGNLIIRNILSLK